MVHPWSTLSKLSPIYPDKTIMAVPLLSPGRHHGDAAFGNVDTASHHDSMNRLSPGVNSRNSSYRTSAVGSSSASIHTAGEAALMDRQRSASRVSETLASLKDISCAAVLTFIYTTLSVSSISTSPSCYHL